MIDLLRRTILPSLVLFACLATMVAAQNAPETSAMPTDALIQALEDPEARARIIEALRDAPAEGDAAVADVEDPTLATQAAEFSRQIITEAAGGALRVVNDLGRLALLPELLTPERRAVILSEAVPLLLTLLVTVGAYRTMRFLTGRVRFQNGARQGGLLVRIGAFLVQAVLRVTSVLVAWVAGYAFATFALNEGTPDLSQAIYLNAFVIFGLITAALSVFASDDTRDMTFAKLSHGTERTIYRSVRRVFGFLIYGLVAAAPIAQIWVNFVLARSVRTVVVTLGVIAAIYAIIRIRRALMAESQQRIDDVEDTRSRHSVWFLAWPWLAGVYVVVSYGVALANPNRMVELVGGATLYTAAGLGTILLALRLFQQAGHRNSVSLPPAVNDLLPPLEARLSGFLPAACIVAGLAILIVALSLFLQGWQLVDMTGWLSDGGGSMLWRLVYLVLGVVVLIVAWSVMTAWIDTRLSEELSGKQVSSRSRTLLALFKNVISIAIVIFGGMTVLSELGIDIAPLLAGAGVLGLAIGFGAQKLVQDIITGIFIQLENAINEGDVVTVAGITGGVEKLTIRSVGLRDLAGTYHLIPFSSVDTVGNFMRRFAFHVEVVGIAYESDMDLAKDAMHRAYDTVKAGPLGREIIAPLDWHGVIALGESSVDLRARVKTKAGQQWAVGRAYTQEVKRELDAAGVEIPFPHRELKMPKEFLESLRLDAPKAAE